MPPKKQVPKTPDDLAMYLVEADENGVVSDDYVKLVRKCVTDKIFAINNDHISICRTDLTSNITFEAATWNALRKIEGKFRQPRKPTNDMDPISVLIDMCKVLMAQAEEDCYEGKKILFFGLLKADIKENKLQELMKKLIKNQITLSIILPDTEEMDDTQLANGKALKSLMEQPEYEENVFICSKTDAIHQIYNTLTKPTKRAMAWNVNLEIGPEIKISVSGYVCCRKNTASDLKKALAKDEEQIPKQNTTGENGNSSSSTSLATTSNKNNRGGADTEEEGDEGNKKTVMVEFANKLTERETVWTEKDGTVVGESDVGKAYFYGDRLIPFNEQQKLGGYDSGEKCLKLIVFAPRDKIFPGFQHGDGTTLFYGKSGDPTSELKLRALIQALHNTDRVGIARKVYRKNTRVVLGVLSPDIDRKCLVFSELCYADDVSVPHFASLFKQQESSSEENEGTTLSIKEQIIDDLILSRTLDGFHPFEGPVDPLAVSYRNNIASRILDPNSKAKSISAAGEDDNIDIFFKKLVSQKCDMLDKVKEAFPLKIIKQETERVAGANVFKKRPLEEIKDEGISDNNHSEKKLKMEDVDMEQDEVPAVEEKNEVDYDDILDQM